MGVNKMQYKNTKTGVTFSSPCIISGGDWVLVDDEINTDEETKSPNNESTEILTLKNETSAAEENEQVDEKEDEQVAGLEGITKKQIMQELDAFGIKYNPSSKKKELYDLMMSQGK